MVRHQYALLSAAIAAALSLPVAAAWAGDLAGRVEVVLGDALVWDMWRPARLVSNVRVLTRHDVNVEELRQQDTMHLPD